MQTLEGVRILDLSKLLPGDYCSMMLADLGAEVIKIEDPNGGDPIRHFQPQRNGTGFWHRTLNRNKKSIALDIRKLEEREEFLLLIKEADVLLESFRPGRMEALGLSYEEVSQINPRIIYCSISGFGQEGFRSFESAHDLNIVGLAGITPDECYQDHQIQLSGISAGTHGAMGIIAALYHRTLTGKGQKVDISLLRSTFSLLPTAFSNYMGKKETGFPGYGQGKPNYRIYRTQDGKFLAVGAFEAKFWRRVCELVEYPEGIQLLADESKEQEISLQVESIFVRKSLAEWLDIFEKEDICVTPVYTLEEAIEKGIMKDSGMLKELWDEELGEYWQMGAPICFSASPMQFNYRAPFLGEHNAEFLIRKEPL